MIPDVRKFGNTSYSADVSGDGELGAGRGKVWASSFSTVLIGTHGAGVSLQLIL